MTTVLIVVVLVVVLLAVAAVLIGLKARHDAVEAHHERDVTRRDLAYWQQIHPYEG